MRKVTLLWRSASIPTDSGQSSGFGGHAGGQRELARVPPTSGLPRPFGCPVGYQGQVPESAVGGTPKPARCRLGVLRLSFQPEHPSQGAPGKGR